MLACMDEMQDLLDLQAGVVSRRQAMERGLSKHDLARLVRRRLLAPMHAGVYVNHTGEPTWLQRAWAAVLATWPAALSHESALRACEGPGRRIQYDDAIHVAVDRDRHLRAPDEVVVHRLEGLDERALWNLGPPRLRYEDAALVVAAAAGSEFAALGVLATVVQSRRTTAKRILATADQRSRLARREWITSVLTDISEGACSVLEHGYLTLVERPHALVAGRRQHPVSSSKGTLYRDVEYPTGLVVELDGRLFHDTATQRDRDLDRDLDAAVSGRSTVRLSWGQVFDRPCLTAQRLARLQQQRGWDGEIRPCGPGCTAGATVRLIRRTP
jgi:hypothetical protein